MNFRPIYLGKRAWLAAALVLAAGCAQNTPESDEPRPTREPVELRLLVVDDPDMSAAIVGLRAEWKARTNDTFVVSELTGEELESYETPPDGDAIIYPGQLLGMLAQRNWISRLPEDHASHRELAWADTFELLQVAETCWGKVPHAVPFGSPLLTCYYRSDLLEALHKNPPKDWIEFHELAETLARREALGESAPADDNPWHGVVQPLAEGWAGRVLLARAASYAKHRDHYSTLFNIVTMEPLVAGPGFVRALEELIADAKLGPENQLEMDAAAARKEFLAGRAGLALTWPGHAELERADEGPDPPPTGFAELPGSVAVYNFAQRAWDERDELGRVPLVGLAGRLGSITANSEVPGEAFDLLAWLSGREWGTQVSSASPATTLYRRSQIRKPQPWLDPNTDSASAEQYATSVYDAMSRLEYLLAPRIPGAAQYMAALDTAVREAVRGDKPAGEALEAAAAEWKRITEELGLDAQQQAYRLSLGLEP